MQEQNETNLSRAPVWRAFRAAAPQTLPVFAGYLVLGLGYGIYVQSLGLPVWMPHAHGHGGVRRLAGIRAGKPAAGQLFAAVGLSDGADDPGAAPVLRPGHAGALQGLRPAQLLHDLCHERRDLFHHLLGRAAARGWTGAGSCSSSPCWTRSTGSPAPGMGAALGSVLPFSTEGVDFVMTAMFVVIFLNQWEKEKQHDSAIIGHCRAAGLPASSSAPAASCMPSMVCILVAAAGFAPAH